MIGEVRQNNGRKEKTSFIIVDAQSVKNTDTAQEKGYDAGKKISGIKRLIAVDKQGLPHAIHITTANITDRGGALEMFSLHKNVLSDVERSFAWLEKCRRLWKNCERKLNTSLHMVIIAFAVLLVKKL